MSAKADRRQETLEVASFGSVDAAARFTWHRGHVPDGWEPLAELADSCIGEFDALEAIDGSKAHQ